MSPEHRRTREIRRPVRAPGAPSRDLESTRGRACWLHCNKSRVNPSMEWASRGTSPQAAPQHCVMRAFGPRCPWPTARPACCLTHTVRVVPSLPRWGQALRGHSRCGAAGLVRPSALTSRGPSARRRGPEETGGPSRSRRSILNGEVHLRGALAPRHGAPGFLFGVLVIRAQGAFTSVLSAGGLRPCAPSWEWGPAVGGSPVPPWSFLSLRSLRPVVAVV